MTRMSFGAKRSGPPKLRTPTGCCCWRHHTGRGVCASHRRADAVHRRPARPRCHHHSDRQGGPQRRVPRATVYDDVVVPAADRVGEQDKGFYYLLDGLNAERVLIASEAIGTGQAALRRAVATPISAWCTADLSARIRASRSAGRGPRAARGRRADHPACRLDARPRPALRTQGEHGQVLGCRRRLPGRRHGHADPRRVRLRRGMSIARYSARSAADGRSHRFPRS